MHAITEKPIGYMIPVGEADRERLEALGAIYNPTSMEVIKSHQIPDNPKILDVGCGDGRLSCLYANAIKGSTVVGIDKSPEQILVSKQNAEQEHVTNISWEVCDIYHLDTLKEKHASLFDIVHTRFVLTHLDDPKKAFEQMLSMVKPGGLVIIEESGAKKKFKNTPKAIQAWEKLVELQYELQHSYKDTIGVVRKHLSHSVNVSSYITQMFDITIEGQLQKKLFPLGVNLGLKKLEDMGKSDRILERIKELGYEDCKTWLKDLKDFESDNSISLEMENYECIVAIKKQ